jgi:hypothetical protein
VKPISYSPSKIDQFERCQRRFWCDENLPRAERLPTDDTLGSVGRAVHATIMNATRWIDSQMRRGREVPPDEVVATMQNRLAAALRDERVDAAEERVHQRLEALRPGFVHVLRELANVLARFAKDEATGERLVWAEQYLDHGEGERGVRLSPEVRATTRADLIGVLDDDEGELFVLDFKTGRNVVDPRFDTGVLVRARWLLTEAESPVPRGSLLDGTFTWRGEGPLSL